MRAALEALPAFEVAVRGRGATLFRLELVGIHREAHRAARLAPVEASSLEDLVETFRLRLLFHETGAGNDHCVDIRVDRLAGRDARNLAQILDARVGARSDEHAAER